MKFSSELKEQNKIFGICVSGEKVNEIGENACVAIDIGEFSDEYSVKTTYSFISPFFCLLDGLLGRLLINRSHTI